MVGTSNLGSWNGHWFMEIDISCSSLLDNWASPGFGGLPFRQKTLSFTEMHLARQEGPTKEMYRSIGFSTGCAPSDPMKFPDFWISENWLLSHNFVNVSKLMIHDISLSISKMMVFTCFHRTIRDSLGVLEAHGYPHAPFINLQLHPKFYTKSHEIPSSSYQIP